MGKKSKNANTNKNGGEPQFGFIETDLSLPPGLAVCRFAGMGGEPRPLVKIVEGRVRSPSFDVITQDEDGVMRLRRYPVQAFGREGRPRSFGIVKVKDLIVGDRPFTTIEYLDGWGGLQRELQAAVKGADTSNPRDEIPGFEVYAPPATTIRGRTFKVHPQGNKSSEFARALAEGREVQVGGAKGRALRLTDQPGASAHAQGLLVEACESGWFTAKVEALTKTSLGQAIYLPEVTGVVNEAQARAEEEAQAKAEKEELNRQLSHARAEWQELVAGLQGLNDEQREGIARLNPVGVLEDAMSKRTERLERVHGVGPAKATKVLSAILEAGVSWTSSYPLLFSRLITDEAAPQEAVESEETQVS